MRERREKIFTVDQELIVAMLNGLPEHYHALPIDEEIPAGAVVDRIWYDGCSRGLFMAVSHPSYSLVADGAEAERRRHIGFAEFRRIPLASIAEEGIAIRPEDANGRLQPIVPLSEWHGKRPKEVVRSPGLEITENIPPFAFFCVEVNGYILKLKNLCNGEIAAGSELKLDLSRTRLGWVLSRDRRIRWEVEVVGDFEFKRVAVGDVIPGVGSALASFGRDDLPSHAGVKKAIQETLANALPLELRESTAADAQTLEQVEKLVDEIDMEHAYRTFFQGPNGAGRGPHVSTAFQPGDHAYILTIESMILLIENCSGETIPKDSRIELDFNAMAGFARLPDGRLLAIKVVDEAIQTKTARAIEAHARDGGPVDSTPGPTWHDRPSLL